MSDKVHGGQQSKTSKELFRDGFKAFKEALRGAEEAFSHSSSLEAEASELLGQKAPSLAELPKILFKLSQSTSVGAVITSPTGSELMANPAFSTLTRGGGAGGAGSGLALKLKKSPDGAEIDAPWLRASKARKPMFERLFCSDGAGGGQHLDFYCQPLLATNGEFEGAFTLVSDCSVEVSRQEKLKELIYAVEGHMGTLKQSSDELTQFLKSNGQTGAATTPAPGEETGAAESRSDNSLQGGSSALQAVATSSESAESRDAHQHNDTNEQSGHSDHAPAEPESIKHDALLDLPEEQQAEEEPEFDPALLQQAVESASAFILDQEASSTFPEPEVDEGPEELWQEMSNGLADVLNVDEAEAERTAAPDQDLNMTILEDKPAKNKTIVADKGVEPLFRDASGEAASCLVVDDIPVNQKLLVFQLKHFGLNIDTASSGSEALDLIGKSNYQIVFMDCDMPRMSGFDTTAEVRRREQVTGARVPIIGMTSHDREGDKQKCLRAGMNDALPKGVSEIELRGAIAKALGVDEIEKPVDLHENERTFDPQELEELISTFLYAMEMFVSSMQRAIDEKDSSLVRELASSVSGPSRVLGLHDMNKVSQEMVKLSSSGDWPQVRLKYLKLKTVYMRCQEDLRKLCPQAFSQVSAAH
jgi:CheY-like chemotaxis protein